jgi:hypothetical protein
MGAMGLVSFVFDSKQECQILNSRELDTNDAKIAKRDAAGGSMLNRNIQSCLGVLRCYGTYQDRPT